MIAEKPQGKRRPLDQTTPSPSPPPPISPAVLSAARRALESAVAWVESEISTFDAREGKSIPEAIIAAAIYPSPPPRPPPLPVGRVGRRSPKEKQSALNGRSPFALLRLHRQHHAPGIPQMGERVAATRGMQISRR